MALFTLSYGYPFPQGVLLSLALSVLYVVTIYVHKPANAARAKTGAIDRNDPAIVKWRVKIIGIFTVLSLIGTPLMVSKLSAVPLGKVIAQSGILPGFLYDEGLKFSRETLVLYIRDIIQDVVLLSILYIGPLINDIFFESESPLIMIQHYVSQISTLHGFRDLIVGPLTEEIVYTSLTILILIQVPNITTYQLIFIPPLFFSVAHLHHAYEMYSISTIPLKIIILSTLFQMMYTFLFGILTDFVFLRQANLWSCFVLHSLCNFMGVPSMSVDTTKFKYWNYVYYALLIVGMYGFTKTLFPLTESSMSLTPF